MMSADLMGVATMATSDELTSTDHVPAEELARRQGARPITSVAAMARPDLFETDEELDAFLAEISAVRRADV
jgi:hypothetical protein